VKANSIEHLSYSSISMFLDCPESWRRKYIAKEPTKSSPALVLGSAFHGTLEEMLTNPGVDVQAAYKSQWKQAVERQDVFWDEESPEQTYNDGLRLFSHKGVLGEISKIKPDKDDKGLKIERKVELSVPGVPVPIIGFIDCILEDGSPADFKTSARSWSSDKASYSLQALFYIAALNQMGEKVTWRFQHIVFVKTKEPKVQFLNSLHTAGELFFLFNVISSVWGAIEAGAFTLNPGSWRCNGKYCDFYSDCRGRFGA